MPTPNGINQQALWNFLNGGGGFATNNVHPAPPPPPAQPQPPPVHPAMLETIGTLPPAELEDEYDGPEDDYYDAPHQPGVVPIESEETFGKYKEKKQKDSDTEMKIETTVISKIVKFETEMLVIDAKGTYLTFVTQLDAINVSRRDVPRPNIPSMSVKREGVHVGIEIEIENQIFHPKTATLGVSGHFTTLRGLFYSVWDETQDNSLRNEGREYVSKPGLTAEQAPWALALLKLYLSCFYQDSELNYRCGTHIHVEVREFTVAQLINMTCLYILFEDLFYRVSGERYKNIFCVPLRASVSEVERMFCLVHKDKPTYDDFRNIFKHFKKYMAFNLLPVAKSSHVGPAIGTVEFRHHKGESDPAALCEWLQYILDIHHAACLMDFPALREIIFALNSRSDYLGFARQVFSKLPVNMSNADIVSDMYAGSGFIKELYLQAKGL